MKNCLTENYTTNKMTIHNSKSALLYYYYIELYNITKHRIEENLEITDNIFYKDICEKSLFKAISHINSNMKYCLLHTLVVSYNLKDSSEKQSDIAKTEDKLL